MEDKRFELVSKFKPTGDQPEAIDALVKGINNNEKSQVLKGVTSHLICSIRPVSI